MLVVGESVYKDCEKSEIQGWHGHMLACPFQNGDSNQRSAWCRSERAQHAASNRY